MNIGIDIDSVLADTDLGWSKYFVTQHTVCGHDTTYPIIPKSWSHFGDICEKCFHHVLHDRKVTMNLELKNNALFSVKQLANIADLYIVTSRPDDIHQHTIAWVQKVGLYDYFQKIIFEHDKAKIVKEMDLDYHIDDSPKHIEEISVRGGRCEAIAFDTLYNKHVKHTLRFRDWHEITKFLLAEDTVRKAYAIN